MTAMVIGYDVEREYTVSDDLELTCVAQGGSPPADEFAWFQEGMQLLQETGNILTLTLGPEDNGDDIYCSATNSEGSVDSGSIALSVTREYAFRENE